MRCLLNPELRVRRAGVVELERQITVHQPFLAPETAARLNDLRPLVLSDGVEESLTAAVELYDCLRNDYFYQHVALRHVLPDPSVDELRKRLRALLAPNQLTMQFLVGLPVWSVECESAEIHAMRRDVLHSAATLPDLLSTYFRLFGHLPLAGDESRGHRRKLAREARRSLAPLAASLGMDEGQRQSPSLVPCLSSTLSHPDGVGASTGRCYSAGSPT